MPAAQPNSDRPPSIELPASPASGPAGTENPQTGLDIPAGIRRSQEAFRRELPGLLEQKRLVRRWVAYHGAERIGIARDEADLYAECYRRGLKDEEFVVRCIVPELPPDTDVTPLFDV
jgi:hypothetical protein